ncbi:response regulator [Nitrosopumilus zosterae]|uniref:Response regulator n=1 Tax=Nitrosopumilus zosterae TaxID=718286 RepID=A0A2S2KR75_9ARCH|nr:response regulator [Nitrosopumilus zosterae]BDQ30396.1 response regulator [Nitrosopumilus zosterae]GBH34172.1 response regulator [Nitrosopumilus zosterae]
MPPTVIVIDDSHALTQVVSEFLTLNSIDVLAVGQNGKEAVELYKKHSPDFVLMDYLMPEFNGLYGLQNIRKTNPNAKVIMFTGSADPGLFDQFRESGVFAILEKPCEFDKLVETINNTPSSNTVQLTS